MAAGRAATACHAWFRALHARLLKLRNHHRFHSGWSGRPSSPSSTPAWPVLAAVVCATTAALFPRAVAFFLPLVASTSAFCATAYLSASSDPENAAKEVVLVRRGAEEAPAAEAGTLHLYADANASLYSAGGDDHGFQVGCFLRNPPAPRGVDADGEEVVLAGRVLVPAPAAAAAFEEELASMQVDRMAEVAWDSYFGKWSTWNHYAGDE